MGYNSGIDVSALCGKAGGALPALFLFSKRRMQSGSYRSIELDFSCSGYLRDSEETQEKMNEVFLYV